MLCGRGLRHLGWLLVNVSLGVQQRRVIRPGLQAAKSRGGWLAGTGDTGAGAGAADLYRPAGAALLRACAAPVSQGSERWPALEDAGDCRDWLAQVWPASAEAIGLASSAVAAR